MAEDVWEDGMTVAAFIKKGYFRFPKNMDIRFVRVLNTNYEWEELKLDDEMPSSLYSMVAYGEINA